MPIVRAVRSKALLRLAIGGPSKHGKSYTALSTMTGLVEFFREIGELPGDPSLPGYGRICVIDTEHESSLKYAKANERDTRRGAFDFDVAMLAAPYSPEAYITLMREVEANGYAGLIIDQASHEWDGLGGILSEHARLVNDNGGPRKANSYALWGKVLPRHQTFIETFNDLSLHVLALFRAKVKYLYRDNKVTKIGVRTISKKETEYEFDGMGMMSIQGRNHVIGFEGTRCDDLTNNEFINPDDKFGRMVGEWLAHGVTTTKIERGRLNPVVVHEIQGLMAQLGLTHDEIMYTLTERGVDNVERLSGRDAADMIRNLKSAIREEETQNTPPQEAVPAAYPAPATDPLPAPPPVDGSPSDAQPAPDAPEIPPPVQEPPPKLSKERTALLTAIRLCEEKWVAAGNEVSPTDPAWVQAAPIADVKRHLADWQQTISEIETWGEIAPDASANGDSVGRQATAAVARMGRAAVDPDAEERAALAEAIGTYASQLTGTEYEEQVATSEDFFKNATIDELRAHRDECLGMIQAVGEAKPAPLGPEPFYWYVDAGGNSAGPIEAAEVRAKLTSCEFGLETQIIKDGDTEWGTTESYGFAMPPTPEELDADAMADTMVEMMNGDGDTDADDDTATEPPPDRPDLSAKALKSKAGRDAAHAYAWALAKWCGYDMTTYNNHLIAAGCDPKGPAIAQLSNTRLATFVGEVEGIRDEKLANPEGFDINDYEFVTEEAT